jgi:hypothetical protein
VRKGHLVPGQLRSGYACRPVFDSTEEGIRLICILRRADESSWVDIDPVFDLSIRGGHFQWN